MRKIILSTTLIALLTGYSFAIEPIPCEKFRDPLKTFELAYRSASKATSIEFTEDGVFYSWSYPQIDYITRETYVTESSSSFLYSQLANIKIKEYRRTSAIFFDNTALDKRHKVELHDHELILKAYSALLCIVDNAKNIDDGMY